MLRQDPRHQLMYFGLIVDVRSSARAGPPRGQPAGLASLLAAVPSSPAAASQPAAPALQEKAWRPGAFEEQQRKAGLEPYSNGSPIGRDRNVHLK